MATATINRLTIQEISHSVITAAMRELGPGLLESAYSACLQHELRKAGLKADTQVGLPVVYDGVRLDLGYRIDLLVEGQVIIELKSVDAIAPVHQAQVISYLKLSGRSLRSSHKLQCGAPERRHQTICQWHWMEVRAFTTKDTKVHERGSEAVGSPL